MSKENTSIHNKRRNKIRLHHEGKYTLLYAGILAAVIISLAWMSKSTLYWGSYIVIAIVLVVYGILLNFFRCPIRMFNGPTNKSVVAPADGHVVVIEEVEETEYFHDRRLMVSIFMSLTNVHANWIPCEGTVVKVAHQDGNYLKAYLPKASTENERSMVVIRTPHGVEVMARQIAGAMARRIVTYAKEGEECFIDDHMGFIKFGSRVDVYLPLGTEVLVKMGQATVGDETLIARLQ
ncbi:MAG: phosphatidylserine decarboxylase family protein [Bacteroidaceae bacterium]|nr:phosphatidylserine decarboxylase family protein [Bacteroidaceae bacterium]MDE5999564.1 phosphatidylserine decarboxylase family protein [Bacteroidaceae bacterium]MDE6721413.1 phosphatidylserine decarboxylase family protein [Bacteroidaceae bacterium]